MTEYGPTLVEILVWSGVATRLTTAQLRGLCKLGLTRQATSKKGTVRVYLTPRGQAIALRCWAGWLPPGLEEVARAVRAVASHLEASLPVPAIQVEPPAAGPSPAPLASSSLELAARAALGLEPGLQLTIRPPSPAEEHFAGVAGSVRLRIDVSTRGAPRPEVEQLVPENAFWAAGWRGALAKAAANQQPALPSPEHIQQAKGGR